jgi:hypothetical protein
MFSLIREGFTDSKSFNDLKTYFTETLPNAIYTVDKSLDLKAITGTHNTSTKTITTPLKQEYVKDISNLDSEFKKKQVKCEVTGNGDKFDMLTSMASSVDTSQKLRCGWVYNSANFERSNGALGTVDGPVKTDTKGQWMWNLPAAKQRYHTDICKKVQACEDIDASQYKQRCGWCSTSGKAVPVIGNSVAYPVGPATSCSPDSLVTSSANCPKPQPIPADSNYVRTPAQLCAPLQNGALPRDCLLEKVKSAGCSDEGSLYQALKSGSDNDYLTALLNKKAYTTYQERATIPLNATSIKTGKLTTVDALNEFKRIQEQSASDANTGISYAARDLCIKSGTIEQFDFCSELKDSSPGPFSLECVKKSFLISGGQVTGKMCPSESNLHIWNSLGTWGKIQNRIQEMKNNTKSSTRKVQAESMENYYGIKLGSGTPVKSGGISNVGFVRIEGTGSASYLNLSQLVVYDDKGNNVSIKRPTQSSPVTYSDAPASRANDGDERPRPHPYQYHGPGTGKDLWQVQLDGPTTVTSVVVYNRSDCCPDRMGSGFVIKLYSPYPYTVLWTSDPLNSSPVQRIMIPGGVYTPKNIPLDKLQDMFENAGCSNKLTEGHVGWWRSRPEISDIQNDMNAYGSLTRTCSGSDGQHEFCSSGKCLTPKNIPVNTLQNMFKSAGCTNKLAQDQINMFRTFSNIDHIRNDMNAYGNLTKNCSGSKGQHEFCSSGKCQYDAETQKCIKAVEQTGFIPRVAWGTTPPSEYNYRCDDLLCPYFKNKYGSYDKVPATYKAEADYCKSKGL